MVRNYQSEPLPNKKFAGGALPLIRISLLFLPCIMTTDAARVDIVTQMQTKSCGSHLSHV